MKYLRFNSLVNYVSIFHYFCNEIYFQMYCVLKYNSTYTQTNVHTYTYISNDITYLKKKINIPFILCNLHKYK